MTNEELNVLRTLFREEANTMRATTREEISAFRSAVREEVNAAVYASETRLMERLDRMEGRLDRVEERLNRVEDRLSQLEIGQQKLRVDFSEMVVVFDEASKVINDLQQSQRSLEEKFEDNILAIKREMQMLNAAVHNFARDFVEINGATNERITAHERTPFDLAHLRPHSAA